MHKSAQNLWCNERVKFAISVISPNLNRLLCDCGGPNRQKNNYGLGMSAPCLIATCPQKQPRASQSWNFAHDSAGFRVHCHVTEIGRTTKRLAETLNGNAAAGICFPLLPSCKEWKVYKNLLHRVQLSSCVYRVRRSPFSPLLWNELYIFLLRERNGLTTVEPSTAGGIYVALRSTKYLQPA